MAICAALLLFLFPVGCSQFKRPGKRNYQTLPDHPHEQAQVARSLNTKGLEALKKGNLAEAEQYFGDALAADVNYGPAHNNLGQVYLKRHQLYLAAWEFEFAANLMPERVEALCNLGLVYETAGDFERAMEYYETALQVKPSEPNAIGNLARISVKLDAAPNRIHWLLTQVVMHDDRPAWTEWAKTLLATKYRLNPGSPDMKLPSSPTNNYNFPGSYPPAEGSEQLPLPVPLDSSESFDMPDAIPLELSGILLPNAFGDLPQVPDSYVAPANFERAK